MANDKPLILVVDDDAPIQLLMQNLLREFGFDAALAGSGDDAVRLVEGGLRPQLVLLDINMPGMTAAESISALRAVEGLDAVPILILSGEKLSPRELDQLGANGGVQKPFDVPELVAEIRRRM